MILDATLSFNFFKKFKWGLIHCKRAIYSQLVNYKNREA